MKHNRTRLTLIEYGSYVDLSSEIASVMEVDLVKANSILLQAGDRVASSLGLRDNPIKFDSKGVRAIKFSGLIRLSPLIELEVAPKFLGSSDSTNWREDFFFLSTLSRHGRLLYSERLSSSGGAPRDLSTLVARSIVTMYEAQKRRPLRRYRRTTETGFFIDGDPDPIDLIIPSSDGFEQEVIKFDLMNHWNADIVAAARELLLEIRDPSVISSLVRLIQELSPQNHPSSHRKAIPARHKSWKPLHELCLDVLAGLGLTYKQGINHAPGYLVSTWQVWEDLLKAATQLSFGRMGVSSQKGFPLGSRTKIHTGKTTKLSVYPDFVIEASDLTPRILLDAKYKGHIEKGEIRISEADIYESLAFSKAADCNLVVLAYPAQPDRGIQPVGICTVFERIQIDNIQIIGIQVEVRGISKRGGLSLFSHNMKASLLSNILSPKSN